jgi:hypothetical protein
LRTLSATPCDSDTLAAISGAIAEAYYGVPSAIRRKALTYLDTEHRGIFREWERFFKSSNVVKKFTLITKYICKLAIPDEFKTFYREFYMFVQSNPDYDLSKYQEILEKRGIKWTHEGMKATDYAPLDEEGLLALLVGAFRADHFAEGVLDEFVSEGYIEKWLGCLKCIDDERKPEEYKPALRQVKISLQPHPSIKKGATSELLVTEKEVVITSATLDGGNVTHRYEFGKESNLGEVSLQIMADCLDSEDWHDCSFFHEIDFAIYLYELEAEFEDGKTTVHRGAFDRAHMPENAVKMFTDTIRILINAYGFGGIVSLAGFMCAIKKGEVKYCGVEFSDGGKVYHYRTGDLRIDVGDSVIVPVGEDNYEREATVNVAPL